MGIFISAAVVVGLPWDDVPEEIREDCEEWGLEKFFPYYDASREHCLIGILVEGTGDDCYKKITSELAKTIEGAKSLFNAYTGLEGKIYVTPHVM